MPSSPNTLTLGYTVKGTPTICCNGGGVSCETTSVAARDIRYIWYSSEGVTITGVLKMNEYVPWRKRNLFCCR